MAELRRNVVANFAAKLWSAALGLVFPPIYVHLLGIESYGLVGLFATLSAMLAVLDLGLGTTLQRELATISEDVTPESARRARDLVRTFEAVFWCTGAAAGLAFVVGAPWIVEHWLHVETLSRAVAVDAIRAMGAVFALQWCGLVYSGGLLALQKQVPANVIIVAGSTLRSAGSALFVWLVWRSATGLFLAQAAAMGVQTVLSAVWLARTIRGREPGSFRASLLRRTWRFSVGTWGISLLGIALGQLDKLVVSKLLPLDTLGYYTLAATASAGLVYLAGPMYTAVFPRLCQLVAAQREAEVARVYHQSTQVLSAVVLSAAAVLCVFADQALYAWTGDRETVRRASGVLVMLSIGTAVNGILHMPFALQLAYGWTRLTFVVNVITVVTMVPAAYALGRASGAVGIASSWVIMNVASLFFVVPLVHRRLLTHELVRWYMDDLALPASGAVAGAFVARWALGRPDGRLGSALVLAAAAAIALAASALATPVIRVWLAQRLRPTSVT